MCVGAAAAGVGRVSVGGAGVAKCHCIIELWQLLQHFKIRTTRFIAGQQVRAGLTAQALSK
jgi:hypothetical protein